MYWDFGNVQKKKTWLRKILSGSGATEKVAKKNLPAQNFYQRDLASPTFWSNLWNDGYVTLNGFVSCFFFLCKCIVQPVLFFS